MPTIRRIVSKDFRGQFSYDPEEETLTVDFPTGSYDYHNVPPDVYNQLMTAPSRGQFFNQYIRDEYA